MIGVACLGSLSGCAAELHRGGMRVRARVRAARGRGPVDRRALYLRWSGLTRGLRPGGCASLPRMQVLTFSRIPPDEAPAHAINIVNTSAAMVRAGARVRVHVDTGGRAPEEILRSYGTEAGAGLTFRDMSWRWHRLALPLLAGGLLRARARQPPVPFVNQVRPFAPT